MSKNMDFKHSRMRFLFSTSGDLSNRNWNSSVLERCPRASDSDYTLYDENWPSYGNIKIWPTFWHGDVIDESVEITWTAKVPHLYFCKILFVRHQSFIVKSSGQTSWQTHKQTHSHTGEHIITSLPRVIIICTLGDSTQSQVRQLGESDIQRFILVHINLNIVCQYHTPEYKSCNVPLWCQPVRQHLSKTTFPTDIYIYVKLLLSPYQWI